MRDFTSTKTYPQVRALVMIVFVGMLLLGSMVTGSTTWAQQARPTLTFTPEPTITPTATDTPGPTSTPPPVVQPQAPSVYTGPILKGLVLNLSTGRPESGVPVIFATGDVSVEVVSNEGGEYVFENVGAANGVLNAAPSQERGLIPVTKDVAVQLKTGVETIVNLGVSSNGSAAPPLIPTVQLTPDFVGAGDLFTVTVLVRNTLPQAISSATVTDWLPDNVVPVSIHSSTGNPYFSDNLAIAELGSLDAGGGALVEIVAQLPRGRMNASELQGKVSFFYRENAASQAKALGQSNGAAPTVLPVTGVGLPVAGLALIVIVFIVGWVRRRMGRTLVAK